MAEFADRESKSVENGAQPTRRHSRGARPQFAVLCSQVAGSRKADGRCDDAVAQADLRLGRSNVWVCAVADGAGSAEWGGEGARLAVEAAVQAIQREEQRAVDGDRVLRAVRAKLREEAVRKLGAIRQLSTTITIVVASEQSTTVICVGDGAVVYRTAADQPWQAAAWPMRGEYANSTQFVTDDEIVFTQSELPAAQAICVMTDGLIPLTLDFERRQPFAPFFDNFAAEMAQRDVAELTPHLEALLRSPRVAERTDDDLTLVFAMRNGRTRGRPA